MPSGRDKNGSASTGFLAVGSCVVSLPSLASAGTSGAIAGVGRAALRIAVELRLRNAPCVIVRGACTLNCVCCRALVRRSSVHHDEAADIAR